MLQFRYVEILGQRHNFSSDLGERARFECFAEPRRLRGDLRLSAFPVNDNKVGGKTHAPICLSRPKFCAKFLTTGKEKS